MKDVGHTVLGTIDAEIERIVQEIWSLARDRPVPRKDASRATPTILEEVRAATATPVDLTGWYRAGPGLFCKP